MPVINNNDETQRRREQGDPSKPVGTRTFDKTTHLPPSILTVKTHKESMNMNTVRSNSRLKRIDPNSGLRNEWNESNQSAATTFKPSGQKKKSASFLRYDSVTIREYAFIPGDNPSVSKGVPLTIDWDHQWEKTFDLDAYENGRKPRHQIEMKIPAEIRSELLRKNGHSWKDIQASIKMANIARRQRTKTIERLPSEKIDEKLEKIARGVKNIFKEKKKKSETKGGHSVPDIDQNSSKRKDDIDISLSKSSNKYDLTLPGLEETEQMQHKQSLLFLLSDDLSECQSLDDHSGISAANSSNGQNAFITSSNRSDPSNDTSSTEESLTISDNDISNDSLREDLQGSMGATGNVKISPRFHSSVRNNSSASGYKKTRKVVTILEHGSEYNSEESDKDVEIDTCCGGAFGRAGKILQTRRMRRNNDDF
jgi:hypothetical protein